MVWLEIMVYYSIMDYNCWIMDYIRSIMFYNCYTTSVLYEHSLMILHYAPSLYRVYIKRQRRALHSLLFLMEHATCTGKFHTILTAFITDLCQFKTILKVNLAQASMHCFIAIIHSIVGKIGLQINCGWPKMYAYTLANIKCKIIHMKILQKYFINPLTIRTREFSDTVPWFFVAS